MGLWLPEGLPGAQRLEREHSHTTDDAFPLCRDGVVMMVFTVRVEGRKDMLRTLPS